MIAPVVLILPLAGDNDVSPQELSDLRRHIEKLKVFNRRVIVIFKGDRHVEDHLVVPHYPAVAKIKAVMSHAAELIVCEHKLDDSTLEWISQFLLHNLRAQLPEERALVARLGRVLGRAPKWCGQRRILDFYDEASGFSLLHGASAAVLKVVARIVAAIDPHVLILKGAALRDQELSSTWRSTAKKVDLSSNVVAVDAALEMFPKASYLNIAGNQITTASLARCSPSLLHLYMHKNSLKSLDLRAMSACRLESLSVYRNKIEVLQIGEQTSLESVNVGANPIRQVPNDLELAKNLKFLGLARTKVKSLPDWVVESPTLQKIDISYIEDVLPPRQVDRLESRGVQITKRPGSPSSDL